MGIGIKTYGKIVGGLVAGSESMHGAAGTGVSVLESGGAPIHKTVLSLAAAAVTLTDEASTVLYGSKALYTFPEGCILSLGATVDLDIAVAGSLSATADGDFALGSAAADNDASLTGTEADIIPSTTIPQLVASAGNETGQSTGVTFLDGTSAAKVLYLNQIWDDADHDGGSMTVTGTVEIFWMNLGDY